MLGHLINEGDVFKLKEPVNGEQYVMVIGKRLNGQTTYCRTVGQKNVPVTFASTVLNHRLGRVIKRIYNYVPGKGHRYALSIVNERGRALLTVIKFFDTEQHEVAALRKIAFDHFTTEMIEKFERLV